MNTKQKTLLMFCILFYVFATIGIVFNNSDMYVRAYVIINKIHILFLAYIIYLYAKEKASDILFSILASTFLYNAILRLVFEIAFLGGMVSNYYYPIAFLLTNALILYSFFNPKKKLK